MAQACALRRWIGGLEYEETDSGDDRGGEETNDDASGDGQVLNECSHEKSLPQVSLVPQWA